MVVQAAEEPQSKFEILEYRVLGNTVLAEIDIDRLLYPQLGPDKTIADVEAARKALEGLYKDKGFGTVFVDIPEQDVNEGVVRLKVTEGRLDRVRVTGARYYRNGQIRAELPALAQGQVMNLPDLQQQLGSINQEARDRQVTPVLRAGRVPGTVDVELKVKDSLPLHGSAELNDRYSANTTRTRLSLNASFENLFQRYQNFSLQYQGSPQDFSQVRMLAATYLVPLIDSGNVLAFYGVDTNSDFAAAGSSGNFGILGKGRIYGVRYVIKLHSDAAATRTFTLGADYKHFEDDILLTSATDATPIHYLGWTAALGDSERGEKSTSGFNLAANFGLRGVVNQPDEFAYKRSQARANYFYLRADVEHERPLFLGGTVFVKLAGQWTQEPLISNEGFAIGGADTVRGYLESEQLGDTGADLNLELRSASLNRWLGGWAQRFMGFLFYDAGTVSLLDPLPGKDGSIVSRHDLMGAGAGLRLTAFKDLTAALDWAYPLRDSTYTQKGDSRVHFQLHYGF
ncbi:MAG TPA: ShlB/FhaC/HecB family hemolysin secretion/activation protein [Dyella sp.]|nr:ShlB/FhaC/HecB family hemolysin secretion/activation protein [Dyella sp.]